MILRRFVESAYSVGGGLGLLTGGGSTTGGFTTMETVPSPAALVVKLVPLGKPRPAKNVDAGVPAGAVLSPRIPAMDATINGLVISSVLGKLRGFVGSGFTVIEVIVGRVPTALFDSVLTDSSAANLCGLGIAWNESVLRRAFLAAVCILFSSALPASVFVSIPRIWTAAAVYLAAFLGSLEIAVLRSARTLLTASFLALAAALLASLFD